MNMKLSCDFAIGTDEGEADAMRLLGSILMPSSVARGFKLEIKPAVLDEASGNKLNYGALPLSTCPIR